MSQSYCGNARNATTKLKSWKETKDFLLSMSTEDRRRHYKTRKYVPLRNIPAFTPPTSGGNAVKPRYPRNEELDSKISLYGGDITQLEVDAVVNAAKKTLLGGSGVDGAIHQAAGRMLLRECTTLEGCHTGQAKITGGYGLPARYVIHTVGPIVLGRVTAEDRAALRRCYRSSLELAAQNGVRSLALPCISTGVYGYPQEKAACEALAAVREYLDEHHGKFDRVIFCVFLQKDKELYLKNLPLYFPGASSSTGLTHEGQTEGQTDTEATEHGDTEHGRHEERASMDDEKQNEQQTDQQTDLQTERQIDQQADLKTDLQAERQTDPQTDLQNDWETEQLSSTTDDEEPLDCLEKWCLDSLQMGT